MTILDACVAALEKAGKPLSSDQIYERVVENGLYTFGAKDPKSMVRAALRKHLRSAGGKRVQEVGKGVYELPS